MNPPSSGTITFLFTDIEGSTQRWEGYPQEMAAAQQRHDEILTGAVEEHNGYLFKIVGDAVHAAFSSAQDGLEAALAAQERIAAEDWALEIGELKVRMALHTGYADLHDGDYAGQALNRVARILSAGHGGQILLCNVTAALLKSLNRADLKFKDLGTHQLKDLTQPAEIYQVLVPGLQSEFPPLNSLNNRPNNLPVMPTPFIGRQGELAEVRGLLSVSRLLTLTGPGGTGKTRLGLQLAAEVSDAFVDGVFFVPLASIRNSALIPSAIAERLGLRESAERTIMDSLKSYLKEHHILLLVDNYEHVIDAATLMSELLGEAPMLKIVVTSREALRVYGEQVFYVEPLSVPEADQDVPAGLVSQYEAVALFVQRAKSIASDFRITEENAAYVVQICQRLDGLPLAVELAAARVGLFPPKTLLQRLDRRLPVLTSKVRDLPARQKTLREALQWSYDLLEPGEQELFARLGVFNGGCTLEAVESVCGPDLEIDPLDGLESLLNKSLLRRGEEGKLSVRFSMLETIREYALDQLNVNGKLDSLHARHAEYFLNLAEKASREFFGPDQQDWFEIISAEHDNIRSVLDWSLANSAHHEVGLRLVTKIAEFWTVRGHLWEGRERVASALNNLGDFVGTELHARLLYNGGRLAYRQNDLPEARRLYEGSLELNQTLGNKRGIANALDGLGNVETEVGDYETAMPHLKKSEEILLEVGEPWELAKVYIDLGWGTLRPGDFVQATVYLEKALDLYRETGNKLGAAMVLSGLGEVATRQGNSVRANALLEESLALRREMGDKWGMGVSLGTLGWIAMQEGDFANARRVLGESLSVRNEIGDKGGMAWCLEKLAEVAKMEASAERAVVLYGAASALRRSIGSVIDPVDQPEYERRVEELRVELGESGFDTAWLHGEGLDQQDRMAYALGENKGILTWRD